MRTIGNLGETSYEIEDEKFGVPKRVRITRKSKMHGEEVFYLPLSLLVRHVAHHLGNYLLEGFEKSLT